MRVTARQGDSWFAGIVCSRRRRRRSRRRRYGSPLLDSFCRQSKSRTAVSMVVTVILGEVSIGGDGRSLSMLGFRYGEKIKQGEKNSGQGSSRSFYTALERASSRSRARKGRQRRGEGEHGSVLSSMHTERMRTTPPLIDISTKGYVGCSWVVAWAFCWAVAGLTRPGEVQVSFSPLFSFSVFIFCFITLF